MAPVVTYVYRYKRPPRRKKAVALEGPKVIRRKVSKVAPPADPAPVTPASEARKSAIVTARKQGKRYAFVPDLAEEELQRRRDIADAMFQDFKRQLAPAATGRRRMSCGAHRAGYGREA
jgi:hypothetical protein